MKKNASMELEHRTRGEESRARLLAAAAQEFALHGYHEAKVSAIVASAGVSQPTFYSYFASKEAVFAELVASFRNRFRALVEDESYVTGQPFVPTDMITQLQTKMEAIFRLLIADPNVTRLCFHDAPDAEQVKEKMAETFRGRLRLAQEMGYIRADISVDIIADYLNGAVAQLAERYLLTGKNDPASLARYVAEMGFNGILNKSSSCSQLAEVSLAEEPSSSGL